jgi:hypothetical protein
MTFFDHNGFLAASDAARFILFAFLMVILLGSVGLATLMDERAAKKERARIGDRKRRP